MNSDKDILKTISGRIQSILDSSFSEPYRRKIDVYPDRLNFCCPICGDSVSDMRKKRGNLYTNSLSYHCYNCGEHMGINTFLRRFGEGLDPSDRIAVHEIQQSSKKFDGRHVSRGGSMSSILLERLSIPKGVLFKRLGLTTPYKNAAAAEYLKSRMIDIRNWKYFAYNDRSGELYILNITPDDKVIGFQIRRTGNSKTGSRYVSRRLSKIYSEIFGKDMDSITERILSVIENGRRYIDDEDGIENITAGLDRLSGIFNIMNIDTSRTVTIMEGPIDSLAVVNSIALQGASKQLEGFFDGIENVRYVFDNDKTGKDMALRRLKEHKTVFLWERYMDMTGMKKKVKDINDLQKENEFHADILEKCFSDDEFDAIYI